MRKDLIEKFWEGKCSLDEQKILFKQLENAQVLQKDLSDEFDTELTGSKESNAKDFDALFLEIKNKIGASKKIKKPTYITKLLPLAAAAILLVLSGLFFLNTPTDQTVKIGEKVTVVAKETIRSNNTSKKISIIFVDGSIIKLNSGAAISYNDEYNLKERRITLIKGKARFEVAKEKNKPFTVNANDIITTALGTKFTVYKTSLKEVKIKLFEGRVVVRSIRNKKQGFRDTYLVPGQTVVANLETGKFNLQSRYKNKNPEKVTARIKKQYPDLIFNKELLSSVFNSLEARYNVKIIYLNNQESNLSFTGSVKSGESLQDILSTLCILNNLNYTEKDNQIIISQKQ